MSRESGSVISAVSGENVAIDQSAVRSIDAGRVELRQAAAQHVRGETMDIVESALLTVRAADVRMQDCASIAVMGEQVSARDSATVLLLARHVDGDVRTMFSAPGAFALGAGVVAAVTALRWLRRR